MPEARQEICKKIRVQTVLWDIPVKIVTAPRGTIIWPPPTTYRKLVLRTRAPMDVGRDEPCFQESP